jgi:hypothetical protein
MKKSILTIAILVSALFVSSVLVTSCGSKKEQATEEDHHHIGSDSTEHHDEMAMTYACPMHPEITGKEGELCSKCGMKLELAKDADSTKMHEH